MEGVLPLAALLLASGGVAYYSRQVRKQQREGFALVNPTVAQAFDSEHIAYVQKSATKFNPLMNTMNPLRNSLIPYDATDAEIDTKEASIRGALNGLIVKPNEPSVEVMQGDASQYSLNRIRNSTAFSGVKTCEAVKTDQCEAFLTQPFGKVCGMCLKDGTDSNGAAFIGGLFLDEEEKKNTQLSSEARGLKKTEYSPTIGTCDTKYFATNYKDCVRIRNQLQCQAKQSFNSPVGCSQCFGDQTYQFIDGEVGKLNPQFVLSGKGDYALYKGTVPVKSGTFKEGTPEVIDIPDFKEGTILALNVTGENPYVGGYLLGTTPTGNFLVDMIRLTLKDEQTQVKPAVAGFFAINDGTYTKIRPGRGKKMISLFITNPFTFVLPDEEEAQKCATPFIMTSDGAEFINRDPCYKKGQAPGNYSMDCLQQMFKSGGCDENGTAYPSTQFKANELQREGQDGKSLTREDIGNNIYSMSQQAYTGRDSAGNDLSLNEWDEISGKCLGIRRSSPCDRDNKESGPLSKDCLAYLYENRGAEVFVPGGVGPTYTGVQTKSSLFTNGSDRYCTEKGTMNPVLSADALNTLRTKGGVKQVQAYLDEIHRKANDNTLSDADRKQFVKQCYGVDFATTLSETLSSEANAMCVPQTLVPSVVNPTPGQIRKPIQVKTNWTYTFTINPTQKVGVWSNIFFTTRTNNDNNEFGARCPAVFFDPNSTRLYVSMITASGRDINVRLKGECPLNRDTNVQISYTQGTLTVKCTGGLNENLVQQMETSGLWNANLYVGFRGFDSFVGSLTNLSYCTYAEPYASVLDDRAGRTKRNLIGMNYVQQGWSWNTYQGRVFELAPYGQGPWGVWFYPRFPRGTEAKWIWVRANGLTNEPNESFYPFLKRYINTTKDVITATCYGIADNVGYFAVNQETIQQQFIGGGSWEITLPPGESLIHFNVSNRGGPAGLCVACVDTKGNTVFVSDSSWTTFTTL
jgi:hypothetical protein